jgi:hypothetical protein
MGFHMKPRLAWTAVLLWLCSVAPGGAQTADQPLASFTGTVRHMDNGNLTLARPDQDDLEIYCTHKTRYFSGARKIKREEIKPGDRVLVETMLDPTIKPQAVNVRLLPPETPPSP